MPLLAPLRGLWQAMQSCPFTEEHAELTGQLAFRQPVYEPELAASPTNRVMLAVLEEALVAFQRGLRSSGALTRRRAREADRWIACTDEDLLFSFENICSSLSIDPGYVREGLERIRGAARAGQRVLVPHALRRERIYDRRAWCGRIG